MPAIITVKWENTKKFAADGLDFALFLVNAALTNF